MLLARYLAAFVLTLWPGRLQFKGCYLCSYLKSVWKTSHGVNWRGLFTLFVNLYSNNCSLKPNAKCNYLKYSDSSLPPRQFSYQICVNRTFISLHIQDWNLNCLPYYLIATTLFNGLPSPDNSPLPGFSTWIFTFLLPEVS